MVPSVAGWARLRRDEGLVYLLVSHDLGVVAHMCGRVAVMSEGVIVEELDVADLRSGRAAHGYTKELLAASLGYGRRTAPGGFPNLFSRLPARPALLPP